MTNYQEGLLAAGMIVALLILSFGGMAWSFSKDDGREEP